MSVPIDGGIVISVWHPSLQGTIPDRLKRWIPRNGKRQYHYVDRVSM